MKIVAYMTLPGNCEEALSFYQDVLKGKIEFLQRYKDAAGISVEEEDKEKIIHAQLKFGANELFLSDARRDQPVKSGNNLSLTLEFESGEEQQRVFDLLAETGEIQMPLEDQFWGSRFGLVIDKYGFSWGLDWNK